jgi:predicted RNA binding protein YcfA (HicA-like mRNA interferase family)
LTRLTSLKPKEVAKVLEHIGFIFIRQKGSHRIYIKGNIGITIPWHSRDLKFGTLRHIIKQAGLIKEEFYKILKEI